MSQGPGQYDFPHLDEDVSDEAEEAMVCDMEKREILDALREVIADIEEVLFRHKHYARPISAAYLERLKSDIRFILRRHS